MPINNNPLAHLSYEELEEEMFLLCQRLYGSGIEPDIVIVLTLPKCRQFYKEGTPWVMNHNHRLGVFLKFKQIMFKLQLVNKERIESILNLGCRNVEISSNEIDWLVLELIDVDMGEEKHWLKEYLEYSGKKPSF